MVKLTKLGLHLPANQQALQKNQQNLHKLQAKNKRRVEFLLYAYKTPALGGLFLSLCYIENPL